MVMKNGKYFKAQKLIYYHWDKKSSYIKEAPFFKDISAEPEKSLILSQQEYY